MEEAIKEYRSRQELLEVTLQSIQSVKTDLTHLADLTNLTILTKNQINLPGITNNVIYTTSEFEIWKSIGSKNSFVSSHYHEDNIEIFNLIIGKIEMRLGEIDNTQTITLMPGDSIRVPTLVRHRFKILEPSIFLTIVIPPLSNTELRGLGNGQNS